MKLLRLSGNNGDFEANFMEDIFIEKDSKICLRNLSFKRIYEVLTINANNRRVVVSMDGEQNITIDLNEAVYNQFNFKNFLKDLIDKLNNNIIMTNDGSFVGLQFNSQILNFETNIQALKSPVYFHKDFVNAENTSENIVITTQNRISKNQALGLGNEAIPERVYFDSDIQFTKGSGILCCKVGKLGNDPDNNNGFFMGLSDAPNNSGEVLYNIEIRSSDLTYTSIKNGEAIQTSAVNPEHFEDGSTLNQKDILEIRKDNGFIKGIIRQVSGSTEIFSHTLTQEDIDKDLFPVFGVYGSFDNARISLPRFNVNPFKVNRTLGIQSRIYASDAITTAFNSVGIPPLKTINYNIDDTIKNVLDFSSYNDTDRANWIIQNLGLLNFDIEDDNYVVESLNLDLH